MSRRLAFCGLFFLCFTAVTAKAQNEGAELDSLRKKEETAEDSVVATSAYIRFTTVNLLSSATQTRAIDTTIRNFQNYSPLFQPYRPAISLGSTGLAYRDLLFEPRQNIGFDAGFHAFDNYLLKQADIKYYRARSPFTELYYVNGSLKEQIFRVTHTQNINPRLNVGANFNRIGSEGFYVNQKADHLNAALFGWYESPNRKYNLLANALFNTLKSGENGATINENIFEESSLRKDAEKVRLSATGANRPKQTWKEQSFFLKQMFYLGRIDSVKNDSASVSILPTNRFSHAVTYSRNTYKFFRNEEDKLGAFPKIPLTDSITNNDSTRVNNLRNEFNYSFYLRAKTVSFLRNEVRLNVGLRHDLYRYEQMGNTDNFQNVSLNANLGYRFSDKVNFGADLQQIAQGRNAGDFFYQANADFLLSKTIGRIVLGAYSQSRSPEQMFERVNYKYHQWDKSFDRTRIDNISFLYENEYAGLSAKAEYFLLSNYLYYRETTPARQIEPAQLSSDINLLKITAGKHFKLGKFNLESFVVYQKTDFQDVLRTPEFYTYNSFYFASRLFKVLYTNIGFDLRYNTAYKAPAYAINVSQFYNDKAGIEYQPEPVADIWIRATLRRANLFVKYDYASQGLLRRGYYTVNNYPMHDALLKFGLSWKFYN